MDAVIVRMDSVIAEMPIVVLIVVVFFIKLSSTLLRG